MCCKTGTVRVKIVHEGTEFIKEVEVLLLKRVGLFLNYLEEDVSVEYIMSAYSLLSWVKEDYCQILSSETFKNS